MRKGEKVVIGWCDPGQVDGVFAADLAALAGRRHRQIDMVMRMEGSALVSRSRNELVRQFLDGSAAEWLWMLDADHSFSVEDFDRLCATADRDTAPMVAGVYFGGWRTDLWLAPVPLIFRKVSQAPEWQPIWDYAHNQIIEVDAAGTGCILVHRRVLQNLRENAPENLGPNWCWFLDGPVNGRWIGEDLIFSERVKAAGFPIVAHTGVQLRHRKSVWIGEAQYAWLVNQQPDKQGS